MKYGWKKNTTCLKKGRKNSGHVMVPSFIKTMLITQPDKSHYNLGAYNHTYSSAHKVTRIIYAVKNVGQTVSGWSENNQKK